MSMAYINIAYDSTACNSFNRTCENKGRRSPWLLITEMMKLEYSKVQHISWYPLVING